MDYRQRFLNTLRGKPVDRLPFVEIASDPYELVRLYSDWDRHIASDEDPRQFFGFDNASVRDGMVRVPLDAYAVPRFPARELTATDEYTRAFCAEWGCVAKHRPADENDPFSNRIFEDYVVTDAADWPRVRDAHFALSAEGRIRNAWTPPIDTTGALAGPVVLDIPAPESALWGLLGEEGEASILTGFHQRPELLKAMIAHFSELYLMCVEKALRQMPVDMALVCGSDLWTLVGPDIMKEFFLPFHVRAIKLVQSYGVGLVCLSTRVLMKLEWIDPFVRAGITGIRMVEETGDGHVVAGVIDHYGDELFYIGTTDGRVLPRGVKEIETEVARSVASAAQHRSVPCLHVDNIDPSVPFMNYAHYVRCLREQLLD